MLNFGNQFDYTTAVPGFSKQVSAVGLARAVMMRGSISLPPLATRTPLGASRCYEQSHVPAGHRVNFVVVNVINVTLD